MAPTAHPRHSDSAFDFAPALTRLREGAQPWPELLTPLQAALDGGAALCVIEGPAGSGKSVLLAQALAHTTALHHLLRDGALAQRLWSDAHAMLMSLGFQLRAMAQLQDEAPTLRLTQTVGQAGGEVSGARIGRLIASPWALPQVELAQQVGQVSGAVRGVVIEEWVAAYQALPLGQFADMALWAPLRRLQAREPGRRWCLFIDAFDADPQALLGWLPRPTELRQIGTLQLVIASRPHAALVPWREAADWAVDLGSESSRAAREALAQRLITAAGARAQAAAWLQASEGSPLYLALALREGGGPGALPQGLAALQRHWLKELAALAPAAPVLLRLLAAVTRPWPAPWLAQAAGLTLPQATQALEAARPWLREGAEGQAGWLLAQRSWQETLAVPAQTEADHAALLGVLAAQPPGVLDASWLDAWALHATQGDAATQARWLAELQPAWWAQRLAAQGHLLGLQADLARAWPLARDDADRERLLALGAQAVASEEALPPDLLPLLASQRGPQAALEAVGLELEAGVALARCLALVRWWFRAEATQGLAWAAWREGLAVLKRALAQDDDVGSLVKILLSGLPTVQAPGLSDAERETLRDAVRRLPPSWRRPPAMTELARVLAAVDDMEGGAWFEAALDDIRASLRSSAALEQWRWLQARLAWRDDDAAALLSHCEWHTQAYSVRGVLALAGALRRHGDAGALAQLGQQLEQRMAGWTDPYQRALGEALLAEAWAEGGEAGRARASLARSDSARAQIGSANDPDAAQQQRPRQVTDALCTAAQAAVAMGAEDADLRLEAGWTAWRQLGAHSADAEGWVALQARAQPALLPVYLAQAASPLQRAALTLNLAPPALVQAQWQAALAAPAQAVLAQDRPPWHEPQAPDAAAARRPALLAEPERVPAPNEFFFVVPGPGVPWTVDAGLSQREAALLGCARALRDAALPEGESAALRALALALVESGEGPALRLRALESAWALATAVPAPWLRAPVQAAVLGAMARLGLRDPAQARAAACLRAWRATLAVTGRGMLPCAGFGLALGLLAAARRHWGEDDAPLWDAHALGPDGAAAAWAAWRWAQDPA